MKCDEEGQHTSREEEHALREEQHPSREGSAQSGAWERRHDVEIRWEGMGRAIRYQMQHPHSLAGITGKGIACSAEPTTW